MKLSARHILWMLVPLITMQAASALDLKLKKSNVAMINYNEWIPQQQWPDEIDNIKQYYPSTQTGEDNDTTSVVTGKIDTPGLDATQCFLAALVFASNNFDIDEKEGFEEVDYNNHCFKMLLKDTQGANNNETSYTRSLECKALDGGLDFTVSDIDCRFRDKGIIPRTIKMERLQPDKNNRHAELVKEFTEINSTYLNQLSEYMLSRKDIKSPNFSKLRNGEDVTEGMNMDEVTILLGPPMNKRKSGERHRWIYSNDFVVIFTDGIVTKIVN